ncbi:hypothetical protein SAMN06272735_9197 [Streptomyces sp. TLI_55]|uniref:hypothetical protein n=1 Tax=Streptomyces sp. TLI_55 TaxID=1938861 RepID=UPI000BD5BDE5|nr:hypothetical protein [Streptomyces sp. TLI_55]SNX88703.1 hypothetical protein SAMN06272735_9197 [Streptomyces sp. TLI_55]
MEGRVETVCRICGLDVGEVRFDGDGLSVFVVCACCGCESGVEDGTAAAVRRHRESWIGDGAPWFEPKARPADWDLELQLSNIPPEWR